MGQPTAAPPPVAPPPPPPAVATYGWPAQSAPVYQPWGQPWVGQPQASSDAGRRFPTWLAVAGIVVVALIGLGILAALLIPPPTASLSISPTSGRAGQCRDRLWLRVPCVRGNRGQMVEPGGVSAATDEWCGGLHHDAEGSQPCDLPVSARLMPAARVHLPPRSSRSSKTSTQVRRTPRECQRRRRPSRRRPSPVTRRSDWRRVVRGPVWDDGYQRGLHTLDTSRSSTVTPVERDRSTPRRGMI